MNVLFVCRSWHRLWNGVCFHIISQTPDASMPATLKSPTRPPKKVLHGPGTRLEGFLHAPACANCKVFQWENLEMQMSQPLGMELASLQIGIPPRFLASAGLGQVLPEGSENP